MSTTHTPFLCTDYYSLNTLNKDFETFEHWKNFSMHLNLSGYSKFSEPVKKEIGVIRLNTNAILRNRIWKKYEPTLLKVCLVASALLFISPLATTALPIVALPILSMSVRWLIYKNETPMKESMNNALSNLMKHIEGHVERCCCDLISPNSPFSGIKKIYTNAIPATERRLIGERSSYS